jgi:hypothetical protein
MRSLKEEKVEAVLRIVEDKLMYSGMVFTSTGKLIYETSDSFLGNYHYWISCIFTCKSLCLFMVSRELFSIVSCFALVHISGKCKLCC